MTSYSNHSLNTTSFCGFPAFCDISGSVSCATVPLKSCQACSMAGAAAFMVFCLVLGLSIVAGNVLVILVTVKMGAENLFAMLKISLALADLFTGFQLLIVTTYNFIRTINVTSLELDRIQLSLRGSAQATVGGIFLLLTFTSSLYHLVFMGAQRYYAIKWPLHYRNQSATPTLIGIASIWGMSIFISSIAAWFPNSMAYSYHPSVFLFYISMKNASNLPMVLTLVVLGIVIPYLLMSCVTVMTLVFVRKHTSRSSKSLGSSAIDKNELKIFKTVGIMQIGFTTALLPVVTINAMYFGGIVGCTTISIPFLVCFYIGMINSLINVIIYSARDKKFRRMLKRVVCPKSFLGNSNIALTTFREKTTSSTFK